MPAGIEEATTFKLAERYRLGCPQALHQETVAPYARPHYDQARWWMEYRLNGRRVHRAIPQARTKAQAERAEVSEREAIYNRRYNKGTDIGFRDYYDESYLPWLTEKKASQVLDAESRVKKLKEYFGNRMLSDITRRDVERFQLTLRGKKTPRKVPRKGATINRYVYLLSAIFSRAVRDEVVELQSLQ